MVHLFLTASASAAAAIFFAAARVSVFFSWNCAEALREKNATAKSTRENLKKHRARMAPLLREILFPSLSVANATCMYAGLVRTEAMGPFARVDLRAK